MATEDATPDDAPAPGPPPVWRADPPPARGPAADGPVPRQVAAALLLLLAVAGGITALLTWAAPRRPAALVPLMVGESSAPGGPPPLVAADRAALLRSPVLAADPDHAPPTRAGFDALLRSLPGGRGDRPVVVYVAARAECDRGGRVVVLPADVRPDRPQDGVPLRDVLDRLQACPARHKLLVLDLCWPAVDPAAAVAAGGVSARIPDELDAVDDPDRLVLCSAAPGQVALVSEDLGRTVFGFYLEEGLNGWAAPVGGREVTARGLARFVQARVRRWAEQNRGAKQTPVLFGDAPDFALAPVRGGRPADPLDLPPLPEYPGWLKDAWAARDRLRDRGADRVDPRAVRRLEEQAFAAETAWRGGADSPALRRGLKDEADRTVAAVEPLLAAAEVAYRPPSLAARAGPADPGLTAAVRDLLHPSPAAKPEDLAKAGADVAAKLKAKPPVDAARAVFDAVADDRAPTPDVVRRADELVRSLDPRPSAVELVFLSRLADAARTAGPGEWRPEAVARGLAAVRAGERAARAAAFPGLPSPLERAARDRYDGETLLLAAGYAPPGVAGQLLTRAEDADRDVVRAEDAAEAADAALTRAFALLPGLTRLATHQPDAAAKWLAAAAVADDLASARRDFPGRAGSAADLARATDTLGDRTRRLETRLAAAAEPFQPAAVKQAVAAARLPDPTPAAYRAVDALLSTPTLPAGLRAEVWQAAREAGGRLAAATRATDQADGQPQPSADPVQTFGGEWEADELAERDRRARELRVFAGLLRLAGLPVPPALAPFADPADAGGLDPDPRARARLAAAVRTAWTVEGPPRAEPLPDLGRLDRLARVVPPGEPIDGLSPDDAPPAVRLRDAAVYGLRIWLAGWYEHAAADPGTGGFFAAAAAEARPPGVPVRPPARPTGDPAGVELSPAGRTAVYPVRIEPPVGAAADVTAILPGDEWFDARPGTAVAGDRPGEPPATTVPFQVVLRPTAGQTPAPPPRGFLVRVGAGGRGSYTRVPVSLDAVRDRLEVLFSPDPNEPTAPSAGIAVRPGGGRETVYLYLWNPGDRPRSLAVELAAGATVLRGQVKLSPGGTAPVRFAPAAAPPPVTPAVVVAVPAAPAPALLDELTGPFVLRVLDADKGNRVVLRREVRPEVRNPASYCRLVSARALPPGPATDQKPRIEVVLRATAPLVPPVRAEFRVAPADPDRPGPPPAGTLRGDLPEEGDLRLFADGLTPGPDGDIWCWVDVDGVERVFVFRIPAVPATGDPLTLRPLSDLGLWLAVPGGVNGPRVAVRAVVDNPPPGAGLELAIGRLTVAGLEADTVRVFPTARQARIGFAAAPDGGLRFDALLRDWVAEFDVSRVRGRRTVRARLTDRAGGDLRTASAPLVLDDRPPERVAFLDLPRQVKLGTRLSVKATGRADVAGVKEVQFFFGKPADGKVPPGVTPVAGVPTDPDRTVWTADLVVPKDRPGPLDLGVRVVSGTGAATAAVGAVELVDFDPVQTAPGKVIGTVVEGQIPQPGLEVVLRDEKGGERGKTKSGADGGFKFDPIPPGAYKVLARKPISGSAKEGTTDVKVPPGGVGKARVELYLSGR